MQLVEPRRQVWSCFELVAGQQVNPCLSQAKGKDGFMKLQASNG
jgi:hypothetical protein